MTDWLTSHSSNKVTPSTGSTVTGSDWLSSKSGGVSTYRPNQLVSDIKPSTTQISEPIQQPNLIQKAGG